MYQKQVFSAVNLHTKSTPSAPERAQLPVKQWVCLPSSALSSFSLAPTTNLLLRKANKPHLSLPDTKKDLICNFSEDDQFFPNPKMQGCQESCGPGQWGKSMKSGRSGLEASPTPLGCSCLPCSLSAQHTTHYSSLQRSCSLDENKAGFCLSDLTEHS